MSLGLLLLIAMLLALAGIVTVWPCRRGDGWRSSGGLGPVLFVVVVSTLTGVA